MTDHPLLFKPHMAQGVHDRLKTMTRRICKVQPTNPTYKLMRLIESTNREIAKHNGLCYWGSLSHAEFFKCPYEIGDQLWVKEVHYAYGTWNTDGYTNEGRLEFRFEDFSALDHPICFPINKPDTILPNFTKSLGYFKRNSLFMPKKHCRTWLEITGIRVERLQDISEEDAEKEGIDFLRYYPDVDETLTAKELFQCLWDSINLTLGHGWDKGDWVWAYEFKRIEK